MKYCLILLVLTTSVLTLSAQENTASANVSSFELYSPQLKSKRKIWVYLPYNYQSSKKDFPVIYMHDGQNLFDRKTSAFGEWQADETLDSLKAQVIVIGIEHGGERRIAELTPYPNAKYGGGEADPYLDFLIATLKPYVDKNYRTKPDKKNTMIFGSSLGGLVSYYALLKYPDVFGGAGIFSPSFWFSESIYTLTQQATITGSIYFMAGDTENEDMVPDLNRMEKLISGKMKSKKRLYKKIVTGGKHNEALWAKEFAEAYLWLMAK